MNLSVDLACRLTERVDLIKAGWWRWLAFFAVWYPLGFVGQLLSRLAAVVGSYALGSNVRSHTLYVIPTSYDARKALCPQLSSQFLDVRVSRCQSQDLM